jgi:ABC-type phosphate transport system permease subunit
MLFEHHKAPLISRPEYYRRLVNSGVIGLAVLAGGWLIGILGYRLTEGMPWVDAILNAAMILGGMGPVDTLHSTASKLFASFYAIFSGVIFLAVIGIMAAPVYHRFMHRFHLESDQND